MFRRVRGFIFALAFAVLGAVLGRIVARLRRQAEAGEQLRLDMAAVTLQPRDLVPGLVAALRVRERPWSFLHVPAWLAAFAINFAFAALARELGPLAGALGGRDDGRDDEAGTSTVWTAEGGAAGGATSPSAQPPGFRAFAE